MTHPSHLAHLALEIDVEPGRDASGRDPEQRTADRDAATGWHVSQALAAHRDVQQRAAVRLHEAHLAEIGALHVRQQRAVSAVRGPDAPDSDVAELLRLAAERDPAAFGPDADPAAISARALARASAAHPHLFAASTRSAS